MDPIDPPSHSSGGLKGQNARKGTVVDPNKNADSRFGSRELEFSIARYYQFLKEPIVNYASLDNTRTDCR